MGRGPWGAGWRSPVLCLGHSPGTYQQWLESCSSPCPGSVLQAVHAPEMASSGSKPSVADFFPGPCWSLARGRSCCTLQGGKDALWSGQGQAGARSATSPHSHRQETKAASVLPTRQDAAEHHGIPATRSSGSRNLSPVCKPLHAYL